MAKKEYLFSVIIPIYNVAKYLDDAINSIINQTIGFNNIEIILVNDGSTDNADEICNKYVKLYPLNIKYYKQVNSGVSTARNLGLKYASGKYINFLDGDDKWDLDVFNKAYQMFEKNTDVDIIGVRQKYFEKMNSYPSLDFKFNKDKVVSILENYDHIQLSVTSAFIRKSAIGKIRFDKNVKYSEDAKFLNEIIVKHGKLGIISSSLHHYRKRFDEDSAIQTKNYKEDWYLITPLSCYEHAFNLSKMVYGEVIPYFAYYVAYDYQWRIREIIPSSIPKKVLKKYLSITKKLFKEIDDYIFLAQKNMSSEYKIRVLSIKYHNNIVDKLLFHNHSLYFNGFKIIDFTNCNHLNLNILNFNTHNLEIRGTINLPIPFDDYNIYAVVNNKKRILINKHKTDINIRKSFNEAFISNHGFDVNIPLNNLNSLYFELEYRNLYKSKICFKTGLNSKVNNKTKNYYVFDNKIYYIYKSIIKCKDKSIYNLSYFKLRFLKNIILNKEFKVLIVRLLYYLFHLFKKREIWIISDRIGAVNDNGYAFYNYLNKIKPQNVNYYFVINKDSYDYQKVKKQGKVLIFNSLKYKLYFLLSDKIISSQADDWVTNPFGCHASYYSDLYNSDFIFLTHGILKHDLSFWLNSYEKNIKMIVSSTINEYNLLLNGNYGFNKDVIKLTGMPRFDNLKNNNKKIIAVMPTWRLSLANNINKKGIRPYNYSFKNSKYFNFYNHLINDKKLLNAMDKYGYKGIFVVHPSHAENYKDFKSNKTFDVVSGYADYQKIFGEASLLISDYSSVLFDFSYLKKPVIYTKFDKKDFYKEHFYTKAYYEDEKDGFGPVKYTYNGTVNSIIDYIEHGCKLENKYFKRINTFYKYYDENNSERVYNEIINRSNLK